MTAVVTDYQAVIALVIVLTFLLRTCLKVIFEPVLNFAFGVFSRWFFVMRGSVRIFGEYMLGDTYEAERKSAKKMKNGGFKQVFT